MSDNERSVEQVDAADLEKVRKAGLIMLGIFGVLTLLFVCGGGLVTGVVASGSERKGVAASMFAIGPAMFALSGLVGAVIGHFAIKEKLAFKIILPLALGFFIGPCSVGCLLFFYEAIWPSL